MKKSLCISILTALAMAFAAEAAEPRTTFVHLFEWTWKDIAAECETFLGPNGFGAVQVSPPQEHAVIPNYYSKKENAWVQYPWFQRYQPVSYKLESRSGNREEFIDMVRRCKAAGVDIYVDAVINHMTWVNSSGRTRYGSAGSPYNWYDYPGTYSTWDFHRCSQYGHKDIYGNPSDIIQGWEYGGNRWAVQTCNLGVPGEDIADLNTASPYVQDKIGAYLNDLLDIGVAGFRIDAAKHMAAEDLKWIFSRLKKKPFIYSEVIDFGNEVIRGEEYFQFGKVSEFRYGQKLAEKFRGEWGGKLADLQTFGQAWSMYPSQNAQVMLDNHDNQRGHGAGGQPLTHREGSENRYALANVFMLAWPYGHPQIMSSYRFQHGDAGPPSDAQGRTRRVYAPEKSTPNCGNEWVCEHRWPSIARMVGFRNATDGQGMAKWWTDGGNRIAFARGNKGYVVINKTSGAMDQVFDTGLPAGSYCDVISGQMQQGDAAVYCSGQMIDVDHAGRARIHVNPYDAAAIHIGQKVR